MFLFHAICWVAVAAHVTTMKKRADSFGASGLASAGDSLFVGGVGVHVVDTGGTTEALIRPPGYVTYESTFGKTIVTNRAGDVLAVGHGEYVDDASGVHIYRRNGSTWVLDSTVASPFEAGSIFGSSLAMNDAGTRVAIGAPGSPPARSGSMALFGLRNGTWEQLGNATGRAPLCRYGASLSMDAAGDRIAVGVPGASHMQGEVSLLIYTEKMGLVEFNVVRAPERQLAGRFGGSVAVDDAWTRMVVGAIGLYIGRVYLHNISSMITTRLGGDGIGPDAAISRSGEHVAVMETQECTHVSGTHYCVHMWPVANTTQKPEITCFLGPLTTIVPGIDGFVVGSSGSEMVHVITPGNVSSKQTVMVSRESKRRKLDKRKRKLNKRAAGRK